MFNIIGSKSIFNKGELEKIIIYPDGSLTLAFKEGYDEAGTFIPVGSDHLEVSAEKSGAFLDDYFKAKDKTIFQETYASGKVVEARTIKVEEISIEEVEKIK